jgi:hypothetical protein
MYQYIEPQISAAQEHMTSALGAYDETVQQYTMAPTAEHRYPSPAASPSLRQLPPQQPSPVSPTATQASLPEHPAPQLPLSRPRLRSYTTPTSPAPAYSSIVIHDRHGNRLSPWSSPLFDCCNPAEQCKAPTQTWKGILCGFDLLGVNTNILCSW